MKITAEMIASLRRPAPYETGEPLWTHPHIATEMLKAHLDPTTDAASYKPDTIRRICAHLTDAMQLAAGSRVVDLGCGPGLYCHHLAASGVVATGIDQSENSLRHARELCGGQHAEFMQANYLQPFGENAFDAALLISQDYGALPPAMRAALLANVRQALRSGGLFALDVCTPAALTARGGQPSAGWEAAQAGFWRPHPYLMLHEAHVYPEIPALCDLYAVLDDRFAVYRVWQNCFSPEMLTRELAAAGFRVTAVWSDLTGAPYRGDSTTVAVLAQNP